MEEFTKKQKLDYTHQEIFGAIKDLEKDINQAPTTMEREKRNEIINYYLSHRRTYDDMNIEDRLEEVGFECLLREISK